MKSTRYAPDRDNPPNESRDGAKGEPPWRVAARLLEQHHFLQDEAGQMFLYNGHHWKSVTDHTLLAMLLEHGGKSAVAQRVRNEALSYLKAKTHRRGFSWGRVADHEVAFENGVLDLWNGSLRDHDPADFLENVIPHAYVEDAQAPAWHRALDDWFDDELTRRDALQEFFGYVLLPHAKWKKALFLIGPGDAGKSVPIKLLKLLAGEQFTCSLPVTQMDDPRRLFVIVGKRLNIMTELTSDAMIQDGGFKTLVSTEEPIFIDPKFREPFTYTPRTKHVFAANSLPTINDRTEATFNRLLVVPFDRVLPVADQDRELITKLEVEIPGITNWALEGARRLIERRGLFTPVAPAAELIDQWKAESNPVADFVKQRCRAIEGVSIPLNEVTREFNRWYDGQRLNVRKVGKMLRAAQYEVRNAWRGKDQAKSLIGFEWAPEITGEIRE